MSVDRQYLVEWTNTSDGLDYIIVDTGLQKLNKNEERAGLSKYVCLEL